MGTWSSHIQNPGFLSQPLIFWSNSFLLSSEMCSKVFVSVSGSNISAKPLLCLGESVEADKWFWNYLNLVSLESLYLVLYESLQLHLPWFYDILGRPGVFGVDYGLP